MNCQRVFASDEIYHYIEIYNLVKLTHNLPREGGIYAQDNKTMQAIQHIDTEINRIQTEIMKREQSKYGK